MHLRLWIVLFFLWAPPTGMTWGQDRAAREPGQEEIEDDREEDSEDEELDERLREAELNKRLLERRIDVVSRRVRILRELRDLRREAQRKIRQIEEDEVEEPEELEERIERIEFEIETLEGRLEVLHHRERLIDLEFDVAMTRSRQLRRELGELEDKLDRGTKIFARLFRAIDDGEEEEAEELGGELEELHEKFEGHAELLGLKIELFNVRRDGDLDDIEELERELKHLQEELGVEPEAENPNEEGKPRPRKRERKQAAMPSLEPTTEDFAAVATLDLKQHIAPLLSAACADCHSGESSSGDLDIDALMEVQPLVVNRRHWVNIIQQLKVRSMPPADADQPTETDRRTMVAWLTNAVENFDYTTVHSPGYEPARRLTHEEYNNTIRDLTGIDIRPTDRFPDDLTASSGFENSANSLFVQPALLERYLGAAEAVVDAAWPEQPTSEQQKQAWKNLTGDVELTSDTAEQVLRGFLVRAYRREVSNDEVARLTAHFDDRVKSGISTKDAMRDVLRVVLVSPSFLIRSEEDAKNTDKPWRVSDYELASRLSYFLWASTPDEPLLRVAKANQLHEPGVLRGQVQRMLDDKRSRTLGTIFASQWLGFTNLPRVQRDQIDNPWATDSLVDAMATESAMLFNSIVTEDQQLDRLIDADYTFLNAELAKHYRMKGVRGEQMQRVSLTNSPRRGILGHGSILAITSFPGRTSPVVRGNWVLSSLLGTPPPPPPPNASEFDERILESDRLSPRQKLERHRSNPNCYTCHSQIDPLGFALEEFEWFGRYRGRRVDSTGQLPGGKTFKGLRGLSKTLIEERIDDLVTQITRKMLSYALGRQLEYYDEATVRTLSKTLKQNHRKLRSLIFAIVESDAFQMKQRPTNLFAKTSGK